MNELKLCFPQSDKEFLDKIQKHFGEEIEVIEERSATGIDIIFIVIIPVVALTLQTADFILTHFVKNDNSDDKDDEDKKKDRKIEIENARITLYDYSAEEANIIINNIINNKNV